MPVTALLKAFGWNDATLRELFAETDTGEVRYIEETLSKDPREDAGRGYKEVYKRLRPGDLATEENAKQMID